MEIDNFWQNAFLISAVAHVGYPKNGIGSNISFKTAQNFHIFELFRISVIYFNENPI